MNEILLEKAGMLLNECAVCSVASVTAEGYPRVCALLRIKNDGIKAVYFATSTTSTKVNQFKANSKAGVAFYNDNDSVTLLGNMSILSDSAEKDALWADWMLEYFPNGGKTDPEYTVIKFEPNEASIYIGDEYKTIKI